MVHKAGLIIFILYFLPFMGTSQDLVFDIDICNKLYNRNQISLSYSLLDSLEFDDLDSCDMLAFVFIKSDRYMLKNEVKKGYSYLKYVEPKLRFCSESDYYKFLLQKAYFSSFDNNIDSLNGQINIINDLTNNVSDTSSFGIKRLHFNSKIAQHYGKNEESRMLANRALDIQVLRNKMTHPETSGILRTLAYSYLEDGQFEKAREYFRLEREIYNIHIETFPQMKGVMFYNEGNTHYEQLELEEAISDYDSTVYYWNIDPPSKVYLRYVNEALGDLHYDIGNSTLASKYWSIASEIKSPKSNDSTDTLTNPSNLTKDINIKSLSRAYNDALEFRKSTYGNDHVLTGECLTFVGRLNEIQNNKEEALQTYNEALKILIPGFDFRSDSLAFVSIKNIDRYGFDAFLGMTRIYFDLYNNSNNVTYLDSALKISEYAFQALDQVKISFEDSHTALFWSDFTYPLTELSLKIHYKYMLDDPTGRYIRKAFANSEVSKSYLLRTTLHKDRVLRKGGLPESIKRSEQDLKGKIHRLKGSIRMEEKLCGSAQLAKINVWKDELIFAQQEYASFLTNLSVSHPDHYRRMYETPLLDTDKLLQKLEESQSALVSFFYGEQYIYRFQIENGVIGMKEIPLDQGFLSAFNTFRNHISNYQNAKGLSTISSQLYNYLLGDLDIAKELNLIIIPDGKLYYLPWEALKIPNGNSDESEYLIEKNPISYAQSARLFIDYIDSESKECSNLLLIHPEYESPLIFSSGDINTEDSAYKIHLLNKKDVTKQKILQAASNADIIHFAGHSLINDDNEMMSELDLGKYESEPFRNYEIFDMDLKATLIVLSSCNSGSGKYARGEGIMNLAQAFQQAGSESVIISLWNVDDKSTSELFSIFYDELANGSNKSEALRKAKLNILKNGDPLISHPYFWASFTLYGDIDPIEIRSGKWTYYYVILGIGILFFIGLKWVKVRVK